MSWIVKENRAIHRAVKNRGAQSGEDGTSIQKDRPELPPQASHETRPTWARQQPARSGHGRARRQEGKVFTAEDDQSPGQKVVCRDNLRQAESGLKPKRACEHGFPEIRVDDQSALAWPRDRAGQAQHKRRSILGTETAREQNDLAMVPAMFEKTLRQGIKVLSVCLLVRHDRLGPSRRHLHVLAGLGLGNSSVSPLERVVNLWDRHGRLPRTRHQGANSPRAELSVSGRRKPPVSHPARSRE
jgi:hypothetical protein